MRLGLISIWLSMLLTLTGCMTTGWRSVTIPVVEVPGARSSPRPLEGLLALPPGPGPFPAVILLHGCGGRASIQETWARRLNEFGYAALILDSFGPRGVVSVCAPAKQPLVTPSDRAGDVIGAAVFLRELPGIDGTRIGVLGNSHGGSSAAWVTQARYATAYPGLLRASVNYYGPCRSPATQGPVPLLALAGEDDDWGSPALTCQGFAAKVPPGARVEVHTYPGVAHAFDNSRLGLTREEGHVLGYNHAAAEDSFQRVKAFLDRWMVP